MKKKYCKYCHKEIKDNEPEFKGYHDGTGCYELGLDISEQVSEIEV